jgi:hypothetical protein
MEIYKLVSLRPRQTRSCRNPQRHVMVLPVSRLANDRVVKHLPNTVTYRKHIPSIHPSPPVALSSDGFESNTQATNTLSIETAHYHHRMARHQPPKPSARSILRSRVVGLNPLRHPRELYIRPGTRNRGHSRPSLSSELLRYPS